MTVAASSRPFSQVDVFAPGPKAGNPVAVVHDADGLSTEQMQNFANWTNLSETTFLLTPTDPAADYKLRIFTPRAEVPFAGHPTLGSAHAWLEHGGQPHNMEQLIQECGAGLVKIRRAEAELSFQAPPLTKSGPVEAATLNQVLASLGITADQVLGSNWIDNGPGWLGIRLESARQVLDLQPDFSVMGQLNMGVIGAYKDGGPADFEVRAFAPGHGVDEDPVTGSVNAGLAQWLRSEGAVEGNFTVQQGTVLGRGGRLTITSEADAIWVGGSSRTVIKGHVTL
ncbi:PhzF family phenazine biosynthesis protein [Arthrobacter sp. ES3-54]|uniref:PhzF family phenazine biosynthesis protein n=1 Tax=Arthrobacter sp. ES3-54 TaxID=1502991 RepID=UPI002404E128|nr:PhzF family phenazine biosynthesis protein [Arthrobacter sp. ES3-54]MDF9751846.1 PhzF family phenazine biosynthesis protein [Arthrobacter sp. ES3-54]